MAINPILVERKMFTVAEYEQMIAIGVLAADERLELIEGEILEISPIGGQHVLVINRLNRQLVLALKDQAVVSIQNPIRLRNSEPLPDVAILRPDMDETLGGVPTVGDILLIIEISDTTLKFDQSVKVPLYGGQGIRECWLIDLTAGVIEVYADPGPRGYKSKATFGPTEHLSPQALPDVHLSVDDILGSTRPKK